MSVASGSPKHWILTSYWSLQKYGTTTADGTSRPSSAGTTTRAWSATLLQCSTRAWCPVASRQEATSPSAHTLAALVRPASSQMTPLSALSTATALPSSHSVAGRDPMPTTTRSAVSSVPSVSTTVSTWPSPRTSATLTPRYTPPPSSRCSRATNSPICSPSTEASGVGCGSTSTTSTPRLRRVAATSPSDKPCAITTGPGAP